MLPASLPEYGAGVERDNPLMQGLNVCEHGMEYESLKSRTCYQVRLFI